MRVEILSEDVKLADHFSKCVTFSFPRLQLPSDQSSPSSDVIKFGKKLLTWTIRNELSEDNVIVGGWIRDSNRRQCPSPLP